MNLKDLFLAIVRTGKHTQPPQPDEPGPVADDPTLSEKDVDFILAEHILRKWGDVEYIGPGAAEAEKRRAESLGLNIEEKTLEVIPKKKRRRLSKQERLEKRLLQLQADVERLEKGVK